MTGKRPGGISPLPYLTMHLDEAILWMVLFQGGVKFPTGGDGPQAQVREPSPGHDRGGQTPVRIRDRR